MDVNRRHLIGASAAGMAGALAVSTDSARAAPLTSSLGRDVTQGHLIPWVDFAPSWKGFQSLGLSPDTIFAISNVRAEFLNKFTNSVIVSIGASALAVMWPELVKSAVSRSSAAL